MARHMSDSGHRPSWWRVMYPLFLWGCLVLILLGLRVHERLNARTQITFDPQLDGRPVKSEVTISVDGRRASTTVPVSMGKHTVTIEHPKAVPIITNLFVWYGHHDLGVLPLERSHGTLQVTATPPAMTIQILGPEFSVVLTNSGGQRLSVPTDTYRVSAHYAHWDDAAHVTVKAGETKATHFAPRLGAAELEASHPNATYKLYSSNSVVLEQGQLPALVPELNEGNYRVMASRGKVRQEQWLSIKADETNRVRLALPYALVSIGTQPEGARVVDARGDVWGVTPVERSEIEPGELKLTLTKDQYAPLSIVLRVGGNSTNRLQTNLVSLVFQEAVQQTRESLNRGRLEEALSYANKALAERPSEPVASALQREAIGRIHLRDGAEAARKEQFPEARAELEKARTVLGDSREAGSLMQEIVRLETAKRENAQREAQRQEQERLRRERQLAEQAAQQRLRELRAALATASQAYENGSQFQNQELVFTKPVTVVGASITNALASQPPAFYNVTLKWPQPQMFVIGARQRVGRGYRDCLIVGGPVREGEGRVVFKVFEYEHPPDLKLLGGLIQVTTEVKTSSPSSAVFRQQIAEGVKMVSDMIKKGLE